MPRLFGKLCLYGFGRTPILIVVIAPIVRQLLLIEAGFPPGMFERGGVEKGWVVWGTPGEKKKSEFSNFGG